MSTVTIEDTDTSALLYEPDNVWQTVQTNSGDSADTAHLSKVANANVTLSFTGAPPSLPYFSIPIDHMCRNGCSR